MERRDVIIVGSGPAGAGTALALVKEDPEIASRTLLLDKARHPRDKTCAGGVIPKASEILARLGIRLDVPQVRVNSARVAVPRRVVDVPGTGLARIVRRRELDARLAWAARDRGIELREDERVVHLARDGTGVRVETSRTTYWAPIVVGADGSGSLVRRALVPGDGGVVARAVMTDVPVSATRWDGFAAQRYDFDFRCTTGGLRGYRWLFPCLIDGVAHANVGAYALPPVDGARMQRELSAVLADAGAESRSWKAFPIRTWTPRTVVAAPNVMLVGDAAGCDPLMGEGISFALEYGLLAANAAVDAHRRRNFALKGYASAVAAGGLGRKLGRLGLGSRLFYGRTGPLWFGLASASARAQAIGLAWYNGVGGWDERSVAHALWTLVRRRPVRGST